MKYAAAFVKKVCQADYSADIIHKTGAFLITGGAGRKQKKTGEELCGKGGKRRILQFVHPKQENAVIMEEK